MDWITYNLWPGQLIIVTYKFQWRTCQTFRLKGPIDSQYVFRKYTYVVCIYIWITPSFKKNLRLKDLYSYMCCKHLITGLQNENLYPILESVFQKLHYMNQLQISFPVKFNTFNSYHAWVIYCTFSVWIVDMRFSGTWFFKSNLHTTDYQKSCNVYNSFATDIIIMSRAYKK